MGHVEQVIEGGLLRNAAGRMGIVFATAMRLILSRLAWLSTTCQWKKACVVASGLGVGCGVGVRLRRGVEIGGVYCLSGRAGG